MFNIKFNLIQIFVQIVFTKPRPIIKFRKLETLKSGLIQIFWTRYQGKPNMIRNFKKSVYPKSDPIQHLLEKSKSEI